MTDQTAQITWRDGTPISTRFDDPYFSLADGLAETRHVFLAGNDLPARFRDGFHVAELGFGTGLNFLATLVAWRASRVPGTLRFTSFEAYPMPLDDLKRALAVYPELPADVLTGDDTVASRLTGPDFDLTLVLGDARRTLPEWQDMANAWYLDGFSPSKNPGMWHPDLMSCIGARTTPNGTFATYTAAGHVRRALEAAGFVVERVPGYGRKRHMTRGRLA